MIIKQGVAESTVVVTPNAIEPDKFQGHRDSGSLKNKYKLEDRIVLGFAGWFDNWDRLDLLVDVFAKLKQKYSNISLLLVGDGAVLEAVRDKAKVLKIEDDIILTGPVSRDEVHKYLSLLDIAVITHSNEFGSPVVMFEFMGLRIPIVAPKLLPITDVLTHNTNALLFNVLDMTQLETEIIRLIDNDKLRDDIANAAYKKLMSEHTWNSNAEEIIRTSGID